MNQKLKPWTLPSSYIGATHEGWLVFLSKTRDSDVITEVNFDVGFEVVSAASKYSDVLSSESWAPKTVEENHWVCGWVAWIAIHESDTSAIAAAEAILERLDQYPSLDDDRVSDIEADLAIRNWESCSVKERIEILKRSRAECSVFVARRAMVPDDDRVWDYLRSP